MQSEDFESGKVAYEMKADAEKNWTQNEKEKYPELGLPLYYMLSLSIENPEYGSASLAATAKGVQKKSTSANELFCLLYTSSC